MRSFKKFLEEERSPSRVAHLLTRISKRSNDGAVYSDKSKEPKRIDLKSDNDAASRMEDALTKHEEKHTNNDNCLKNCYPVKKVRLASLHNTQWHVNTTNPKHIESKARDALSGKLHIRVGKHRGKHFILDGHHHVVAARTAGLTHANARVLDLDKKN